MTGSDEFIKSIMGPRYTGSSDIDDFEKTLRENDTYGQLGNSLMGARFAPNAYVSPMQSVGATALSSFVGSILDEIGSRQRDDQMSKVASIMPQLLAHPDQVALPDGVDPEAFAGLKMARMMEQAKQKDALTNEIQRAVATTYGANYDPTTGEWTRSPGAEDIMSDMFGAKSPKSSKTGLDVSQLSPDQAKLYQQSGGDLTLFHQLTKEQHDAINNELPQQLLDKAEAVRTMRERAAALLPAVQQLEDSLTPDQKLLNWAELKAEQGIPTSTVNAIESGFPAYMAALVQTGRTARFPLQEFNAFSNALSGAAPLAQGLTSQRLQQYTDQATGALKAELSQLNRPGGKYQNAAKYFLDNQGDIFDPLSGDSSSDLQSGPLDQATFNALRDKGMSLDDIRAHFGSK